MMLKGSVDSKWELRDPFTAERPKLLLVEGEDEWHLLIRVLPAMEITDVDVRSFGGNEKLSAALKALADGAVTGFDYITCLGVVRDAEKDAQAAAQSISSALTAARFPVPAEPGAFVVGSRRVGYCVLPNTHDAGCFEDVCLACVETDPATPCVDGYVACLQAKALEDTLKLDPNPSKTRVHAFLASREDATIQIGQAFDANCWNMNHAAWQPLIEFIRHMQP